MRFTARILNFFLIVFLLLLIPAKAFAQTVQTPQNLHNYTQNVMIEVASSLSCLLSGVDPINPNQKCLGINNGKIGPVDSTGGAIGAMGNLIAMTYMIPAHTGDYTRYLAQNFGISKKAYADTSNGIGFSGLSPLIPIWTAFRNIAYLLFVIVFVVIGLAIMLRVHIDPRTVMTIENQIPKIIIGLILVTFSFAIAGFLIDLMYISISLSVNVLQTTDQQLVNGLANRIAYSTNPLDAANILAAKGGGNIGEVGGFTNFASSAADAIGSFIAPLFDNPPGKIIVGISTGILVNLGLNGIINNITSIPIIGSGAAAALRLANLTVVGSLITKAIPLGISAIVGIAAGANAPAIMHFVGSIIAFLIITIALLFALLRVWIALLQAYIFILLDIVFAPFWILAGLIPGSSISFTTWVRDLASNLLAFPATIVILLLGKIFIDKFSEIGSSQQVFLPPLIGSPEIQAIGSLIGLGIILILPSVVTMMKAALKAPKFDIASIGAAVGAGTGALGASAGSTFAYFRVPQMNKKEGLQGVFGRIFR